MAHKIKVKRVPRINRDGSVGTKFDFIVRCKRRGQVCTEEKFSTRREADAHVEGHWDFVQRRKNVVRNLTTLKRDFEEKFRGEGRLKLRVSVSPDKHNFKNYKNYDRRAQRQTKTGDRAA